MTSKALFLTSRLPYPPDRGDRVRTYFLLKAFAEHYDVILVSLYETSGELQYIKNLEQICSQVVYIKHPKFLGFFNIFKNILSRKPFQVAYYANRKFEKALFNIRKTNQIDLIYTHLIRLAPYSLNFTDSYRIIDYTDCISLEYLRSLSHRKGISKLFYSNEAKRTQMYEPMIKSQFNEHWVISPIDFKALKLSHSTNSYIIPNPVAMNNNQKEYDLKQRLVFVGNMSVPHNIHAAQFVSQRLMPAMLKQYPNIVFHIIGANPISAITSLNGTNSTAVLGFVDDLYNELLSCDIFIAPMFFCAGIQNKVLEAMACGVPVLTTLAVADSLGFQDGKELLLAYDEPSFIERTHLLLSDESLRKKIGNLGKQRTLQNYSHVNVKAILNDRFIIIDNKRKDKT